MIIVDATLEEMQREIAERMANEFTNSEVAEAQAELLMDWILERYEIRPIQKADKT